MNAAIAPIVLPVRQHTPEWLDARLEGIGASEAAAAIGISSWESPLGLWATKLGLVPPPEPTIPMRLGTELEPFVARLYTEATGIRVRRAVNLRQSGRHPFMLASLDRRAGRKPVELKYTTRGTGYGEAGTDEIPDEVLAQVLHQLIVVDEPEGDVAALVGGRELRIFTVRRDPVAEEEIVKREAELWAHVQTRTEPPIDGSEATRRVLAERYPRDTGEVLEADAELRDAVVRLRGVRRNEAAVAAARAEAENRIKAAMGEASLVRAAGVGEIPWRVTKDRETTDWQSVARAYRAIVERASVEDDPEVVAAELDVIAGLHTAITPGVRRFGPPRWEEEDIDG